MFYTLQRLVLTICCEVLNSFNSIILTFKSFFMAKVDSLLKFFGAFCILLVFNNECYGQVMTTVVSGLGDNYPALTYGRLGRPMGLVYDASGNLFIADNSGTGGNSRFRKVNTSGVISTVAGNSLGSSGSGGANGFGRLARNAQTGYANGVLIDRKGNLLITYGQYIGKVDPVTNILSVFAGNGVPGFAGDGSLASTAELHSPCGMAIDAIGNVYVADVDNSRIRKIDTFGIISTIAGGGATIGDGGPAISANLNQPTGVAVDAAGNIYIADGNNQRIRKVNTSGIISTIAGTSTSFTIGHPFDVKVDGSGNVFFSADDNVYKLTSGGAFSRVAGTGTAGFSGDGGPAVAAQLNGPRGLTFDATGNLVIADGDNSRLRKINSSGIINTFVGNGLPVGGFGGDGGPAPLAVVAKPYPGYLFSLIGLGIGVPAVAKDKKGNLFVADCSNNRVRKVNTAGVITTFAGNGIAGFSGDGGPATAAELQNPIGLSFDSSDNLYIADFGNHHIRKVDNGGIITTVAGGGSGGLGDGGPATAAVISAYGVYADSIGNLYIADADSQRIRKVSVSTGIITTIAGNSTGGYSGDGGPATAAMIYDPMGVAADRAGNVYLTDFANNCIRKINSSGIISTFAGIAGHYGSYGEVDLGDGGPATIASMYLPLGVNTDKFGNVYFSDRGTWVGSIYDTFSSGYNRVRRIDPYGYVTTVAGNGIAGYSGDSYPALTGELQHPYGICLDTAGNLFIADNTNYAVRQVCCLKAVTDRPPLYTGGYIQSLTVCASSGATPINSLLKITDADVGDIEKWRVALLPKHGALAGFVYSAVSTGGSITPVGLSYTPATGFSGIDTFSIRVSDGTDSTPTIIVVNINPLPSAGIISGPKTVCVGDSITLSSTISGGKWTASNIHATVDTTTGVVKGSSAGIDTIFYSVTNSCGTAKASYTVTVNPLPSTGAIFGPSVVCTSSSIVLSDPVTGGVWSSADPYVSVGSSSGVIAGIAPGTAVVRYALTNVCGTAFVSASITVNPAPFAGTITGSSIICLGGTNALSDAVPGGVWSSGTTAVVSVSGTGVVSGLSVGAGAIFYTVTNSCGSSSALAIVNVVSSTPISYITGPSAVCTGAAISLTDATPGGTWSSSNTGIATVSSSGVVTGVSAGVVTISYTATLACGISVATVAIAVNTAPVAGTVIGTPVICVGATALIISTAGGGSWSCSNSTASVSPTGIITGVSAGADTIIYTVTNTCGSAYATHVVSVYPAPAVLPITGASSLCSGTATILSDPSPGGAWTSSNTLVATAGSIGIVTGFSAGTAVISYTIATGCGTAFAVKTLTVNAATAGIITGVTTLCPGGTSTLTDAIGGGVWSSSSTAVATISSSGLVTAIAAGASIISYTVTGACGTAVATAVFTVGSLPVVSPITGTTTLCIGSTSALYDGTISGVWSSSNTAIAVISGSGIVTGIAAGTATISYKVTAGCGSGVATTIVHIDAPPSAGVISGGSTVCVGTITTLSESVSGGTWSSSNLSIASVSSGGVLTGLAAGPVVISYTVTNTCGSATAIFNDTITTTPYAGVIFGPANICEGASITLSDPVAGGVWSSSNTTVAVVSTSGIVTGVSSGLALISYSVTNSCGTNSAATTIHVDPLPYIAPITGVPLVSVGGTTGLYDAVSGGSWSSSNTSVATVNSGGVVTGVSAGTVTITYGMINSYGCTADTTSLVLVYTPTRVDMVTGNSSYKLYPNPTTKNITISWQNQPGQNAEINISDIIGRKILNQNIELASSSGSSLLKLPDDIQDGTYIITIKSVGGYYSGKLVIVH